MNRRRLDVALEEARDEGARDERVRLEAEIRELRARHVAELAALEADHALLVGRLLGRLEALTVIVTVLAKARSSNKRQGRR